jgi:predicted DNA-binding transcriptional regulator YafY
MHRTDRLTGILLALQSGPRSAAELAARFEVSRRTIMRDVDALDQIGVPIIAETGRNGGYRIAEGYWMPPLQLTADEAAVLLFAMEHVGDAEGSPLGDTHRTALEKLRSLIRPAITPDVLRNLDTLVVLRDRDAPDPSIIALLRDAMTTERWVAIAYRGSSGASERAILPGRVYTSGGRWYVDAIDSLRESRRVFRVSRIASARRSVAPPNSAIAIARSSATDGTYHAPEHPLIRARLTARGVAMAHDHPDFRDHLQDGTIAFRCPPGEVPFYGREFLRFGTEVAIESPPELIVWIDQVLQELRDHHRTDSRSDSE